MSALGFQTSFVVAVFVGVVFLAGRFGGDEELRRRGLQVAIGFSMFLLVLSATAAFIRPDIPEDAAADFSGDQAETEEYLSEAAEKASGAGSVHAGVGILLAILAVALHRRWVMIPTGLLLGALLLLLLGSPPAPDASNPLTAYYSLYFSVVGRADQVWDIVRLAVLGVGNVVLLTYTYLTFEAPPPGTAAEPPAEPDAAMPAI
jgi:hypothetical protein